MKTGAWLVFVTVQLKVSVSVSGPSQTVTVTSWGPALLVPRAADDARGGLILTPRAAPWRCR